MTRDLNKGIGTTAIEGIIYNHLNLPVSVKINNGNANNGTISYIYAATGVKLRKNVLKNGSRTSITEYAGNYVYENGVLQFFNTPEGYVTPDNQGGFDYVYQYKDHLGNVRLSYTDANDDGQITAPKTDVFYDGFETGKQWESAAHNSEKIDAYDTTRAHTGNVSGRISKPTAGEKYVHNNQWVAINNAQDTQYIFSGWIYSDGPTAELVLFMNTENELGYFTLVDAVTSTAINRWQYIEKTVTVPASIKKLNIRIDNNGGGTVWFDDISIIIANSTSEIVKESNYYPFGLQHKGYNGNVSALGNPVAKKYMFGGKEYQDELNLAWYDVSARNYDPALGRWMNVDPLAEQMRRHSPYNYAFDNPVYWIDPDGMAPDDIWKLEQSGKLVWVAADDTKDVIYSTNANGNITENSNSLVLEKGSITGTFSTDKATGIEVKNQETADKVFTFAADNLDGKNGNPVEMATVTAANYVGEEKSVVISSGNETNVDTVGATDKLNDEGYTSLKETNHSHPSNSPFSDIPSGYASDGKRYPIQDLGGDGAAAEYMNAKSKTKATHKMYHPQSKITTIYDEKIYKKVN